MVDTMSVSESRILLSPTGPEACHKADDGRQPPNMSETTPYKLSNGQPTLATFVSESPVGVVVPSSAISRGPSPGGSVGPNNTEKPRGLSPRSVLKRPSTARSQGRKSSLKDDVSAPMQNGTHHVSMADSSKLPAPPKRKRSGLGTVIRRIFGRRSVKNRISLPAPVEHHHNVRSFSRAPNCRLTCEKDSLTFITSPSNLKPQRAASAPSADLLRSSALGSHSPFALNIQKNYRVSAGGVPPQPERPPTERPTRPRRASLPSVILSSQEAEDINNALTGLGLQDVGSQVPDGRDIGFAVTSGSNPKRRSRSVGDHRSAAKEHRMSPIQWRQWRRRSDEIRYWRESTTDDDPTTIPTLGQPAFIDLEPASVTADSAAKAILGSPDESSRPFEAHNEGFNFGIPIDGIHSNEHVGLEERMITLELKLMDLDFAISKFQAGSFSPPNEIQQSEALSSIPMVPSHDRSISDQPRMQALKTGGPFIDNYPSLAYYQNGGTPNIQQGAFPSWGEAMSFPPRGRPTSIAITLKASGAGQDHATGVRSSIDRGFRSSITELTIEHYTTLITLIRREQSARMRLEDHVAELQQQIETLRALSSPPQSRKAQRNLGRHFSPDDVRRPFGMGLDSRQQRGRSSNYSGETDTDEDNFHDVYVTPVERGEFERDDFDGEEGVAF